MQRSHKNRFMTLLVIHCGLLPFTATAIPASTDELNQYVLLELYADAGPYLLKIGVKASNLNATVNTCGQNCQLAKLSTTPLSNNGELKISLNDKRANCYGEWSVPFSVKDNQLVTDSNVYLVYLQGASCVTQTWRMEVVEDLQSKARYKIDVTKVA